MKDLIERQNVIDYCKRLIEVERKQGSDVMNYGQERVAQTEAILAHVKSEYLCPSVKMPEWIPVSERLPESGDEVLVYTDEGYYGIDWYDREKEGWFWSPSKIETPIAWMPLPEPFKGV